MWHHHFVQGWGAAAQGGVDVQGWGAAAQGGVEVEGVLDLRATWLTMYSCCMLCEKMRAVLYVEGVFDLMGSLSPAAYPQPPDPGVLTPAYTRQHHSTSVTPAA